MLISAVYSTTMNALVELRDTSLSLSYQLPRLIDSIFQITLTSTLYFPSYYQNQNSGLFIAQLDYHNNFLFKWPLGLHSLLFSLGILYYCDVSYQISAPSKGLNSIVLGRH